MRPNIVFTDDVSGNPVAEVEVRTGPTGQIISRRITKSSGVKSWDDAVLRALDRTEKLPSDNGRYWNPMLITFRLRDGRWRACGPASLYYYFYSCSRFPIKRWRPFWL